MRKNLPFNSLRAFEATARHLNFTRAAEELCISQGAVSRHVGNLEKYLGVVLLKRTTRSLQLTRAGETLLGGVTSALDTLEKTTEQVCGAADEVNLQVASSFALLWLIPRLPEYEASSGSSLLRMTTRSGAGSEVLDETNFDAAVLYGEGIWPGMHADLLLQERLAPVCSPRIKEAVLSCLEDGNDAAELMLLHSSADRRDWRHWLHRFPAGAIDAESGIVFETMDNAVSAAVAGHGVTIGDLSLLGEKLRTEQLVKVFDGHLLDSGKGYYFVCRQQLLASSKVTHFQRWILEQIV